ncbi:MAG: flavodoxin [Bifidobacteriaceae bacterium]|jgi:flavodoxin short chain|nr:flavodoxin [Bifidobacteriaceae bacterium]
MTTASIVYASMTGNTEQLAEMLREQLEAVGIETNLDECTEVSAEDFSNYDIAIVATYTYGEGELPDEIVDLYEDLKSTDLAGKIYGVAGSGDRSYADLFCAAVTQFEDAFEQSGAKKGANSVKIEFAPDTDEAEEFLAEFVREIASA